jgi:hypothetical protein
MYATFATEPPDSTTQLILIDKLWKQNLKAVSLLKKLPFN